MFDISLSELGVVGVVAMVILGPTEFRKALTYIKYLFVKARNLAHKYFGPLHDELQSIQDHVIDIDGKIQPTYNLDQITKEIAHDKKRKATKKNI